jgi:hypothetical protein
MVSVSSLQKKWQVSCRAGVRNDNIGIFVIVYGYWMCVVYLLDAAQVKATHNAGRNRILFNEREALNAERHPSSRDERTGAHPNPVRAAG